MRYLLPLLLVSCTAPPPSLDMCMLLYVAKVDEIGSMIERPTLTSVDCNSDEAFKKLEERFKAESDAPTKGI